MSRVGIVLFLGGILFVWGCSSNNKKIVHVSSTFPKVELPTMVSPGENAAKYILKHFWNPFLDSSRLKTMEEVRLQVKDTPADSLILGIDSLGFETAFGEFAFIAAQLQPIDYEVVSTVVKELIQRADQIAKQGDSSFFFRLMTLCEKYFYDPNSPVLNEEIYIPVLESIMTSSSLSELDKMQYEYQLKTASLNRVGMQAADFEYSTISGKGTLYAVKGEYTLLFFNNPDCYSCRQILEILRADAVLNQLSQKGHLKVLAMYTDEELDKWRKNKSTYPSEWIYACDSKFVLRENNRYGLRAIPSLYLLDKDKKVLLKDTSAEKVIQYFSSRKGN